MCIHFHLFIIVYVSILVLMDLNSSNWFAYLTAVLIDLSIKKSIEDCPGCRDDKKSPLLHRHLQMNLLDKISCYFELIKTQITNEMDRLLIQFKVQNDVSTFEEAMIAEGLHFLNMSTPSTIYFGRYINPSNDVYIASSTDSQDRAKTSSKRKRPKKLKLN